jgi:hypothetical protein
MKELIKSIGIIIIIIGIVVLVFSLLKSFDNNIWLTISGILVVMGLLGHIFINKYIA